MSIYSLLLRSNQILSEVYYAPTKPVSLPSVLKPMDFVALKLCLGFFIKPNNVSVSRSNQTWWVPTYKRDSMLRSVFSLHRVSQSAVYWL
jgi:hypothetical protein